MDVYGFVVDLCEAHTSGVEKVLVDVLYCHLEGVHGGNHVGAGFTPNGNGEAVFTHGLDEGVLFFVSDDDIGDITYEDRPALVIGYDGILHVGDFAIFSDGAVGHLAFSNIECSG